MVMIKQKNNYNASQLTHDIENHFINFNLLLFIAYYDE